MIRLVGVELTRLRVRRAAVLLLAGAIVVPLVIGLFVIGSRSVPDAAEYAQAQKRADRQVAQCESRPQAFGIRRSADAETIEAQCRDVARPEFFLDDYNVLNLDDEREQGSGLGVSAVLAVLMFLLGTTFVGHDWNTGSMSNQLLFEPRRLRIWAAKAIAVAGGAAVVTTVGATAFWLLLCGRYAATDLPLPEGVVLDCLQQGWRAAALATGAAVGGYALTMLTRSTVFTLGLLFGVSVAGSILVAAVVDDPGPWDPTVNAGAVILDGTTYYVDVPEPCFDAVVFEGPGTRQSTCDPERERSLAGGVTYFAVLLGGVGVASAASFRRRDVP